MEYKRINILIIAVLLISNLLYFSAAFANTEVKTENVELIEETPEEAQPENENKLVTPDPEIKEEPESTSTEEITEEDAAAASDEEKAPEEKEENLEEIEVLEEEFNISSMDLESSEIAVTEGGNSGNDLFDFEAFIKKTDVIYGTAPFDENDEQGNDSGDKNGIVRTFDTVTYPIKLTINPKKVDKLNNIIIKIDGTLKNGITDNRVNAKFAVGGYEDLKTAVVGFEQTYTIVQTGNSVMVPISIEVQGAQHNLELIPELTVQVISVDGEDVTKDDIKMVFDELDPFKTSAKVNVKPLMGSGLSGQGVPYIPYTGIFPESEEMANIQAFAVSFGLQPLNGKSDIRGSTFPTGEIKYRIDLGGHVYWDGGEKIGQNVNLNFLEQDEPLYILDEHPIGSNKNMVGSPNTLLEGLSYRWPYAQRYSAANSKMQDFEDKTIKSQAYRTVWDSGDWALEKPEVEKNKVIYSGSAKDYIVGSTFPEHRSDGYTGRKLYGVNEKVFASNGFIFKMPNEYRIGEGNNKEGFKNNVFYKATVILDSYTDVDGKEVVVNKSASLSWAERNNPSGSYSVQTTIFSYPSLKELGTPHIGYSLVSKGDVSTILGTDVAYVGALHSSVVSYGGYDGVFQWNTDAFQLTSEYAKIGKANILALGYYDASLNIKKNDYENHKIYYGVPKFSDNSFENFTQKGKKDYTWFEDYNAAVKTGEVGAMKSSVFVPTGPKATSTGRIPLKVKTKKIGSYNEKGSANIVLTNFYPYSDRARTNEIDVYKGATYKNPSIWSEEGELLERQTPVRNAINFETLAVLNAEVSSNIASNKTTFYNSEEVDWDVKSSIILPVTGTPDKFDGSIEVKQILPKGLDYKIGSGLIGKTKRDPRISKNDDGTTSLSWDILVSEKNTAIENIKFTTTINPFALTGGVQSSLTVNNIISSNLDTRRENLRTTSQTINILKVGMVGIYESVNPEYGGKNTSFTLNLKPYTTIEEEYEVKGLTVFPINKDDLGSSFDGTAKLSAINVTGGKPVSIYLNNSVVETSKPNKVDLSKDGWYKYTGENQDISNASSLLFHIEGVLSNDDNVNIALEIQTKDNKFGDVYYNETTINSATDYKLSPVSNKVKYAIRASSELSLERIQIFTANFEKGLPVKVRVAKEIINEKALNEKVKLALYDKESNVKLLEKEITVGQLERETNLLIPSEYLEVDSNKSYEVRIEGFNEDLIHVLEHAAELETLGYTASQRELRMHVTEASELEYKGVVMTEREVGKDMVTFYETLKIPLEKIDPVKSGYGIEVEFQLQYSNELGLSKVDPIKTEVVADARMVDGVHETVEGKVKLPMIPEESQEGRMLTQQLKLAKVYVEAKTGSVFTEEQKEANDEAIQYDLYDGGHKIYIPIWIEELGVYDLFFNSTDTVGVNEIEFDIVDSIEVFAFMYGHIGSETIEDDEILIEPVDLGNPFPDGLPLGWKSQDLEWFNGN